MTAVLEGQSVVCQDLGQRANGHSTGETELICAVIERQRVICRELGQRTNRLDTGETM